MLGPDRNQKIANLIRNSLATIISQKLSFDFDLKLASIAHVDLSKDKSAAKIFIAYLGTDDQHEQVVNFLNENLHLIRKLLAKSVTLRYVPTLQFIVDKKLKYISKINDLLTDET